MKKTLLNITRFLVGVLFIFSGLIKANDPLGLSYKMQEFFEVWHMPAFNQFTLALAVVMIIFEIVAGVAVLLGWRMQLFAWLLLLLILFFSFLTGYAVLSGKIRECGCFGDCIPLQAMGSFVKDLILLLMILFLFACRKEIKPLISQNASLLILAFSFILSFSIQWYALQYLPLIDCLPYKIGANIPEKMKPPVGSIPDSTVIHFVYEKNNHLVEYTADKLPADFDDSYKFIKRYDKLIRKGNAESSIKDFSLSSASGNDSTVQILGRPGFKLFLFSRNFPETDPSWNKPFSVLYALAKSKNIPVFFITADRDEANAYLRTNNLSGEISVFTCDATAIKTAARTDPTVYLLKKGTILNKWSYAALESAIPELSALPQQSSEPGNQP
ncbi:MAG: DoxX family protein [Bacteroidota bacterium]|nr:DoxX family protein [Bacteroidota bacterium]